MPVRVFAERTVVLDDLQRMCGAKRYTALAIDAFRLIAEHDLTVSVVAVYAVGTLPFTDATGYTAIVITHDLKFGNYIIDRHQYAPSFTFTITGSPPAGA